MNTYLAVMTTALVISQIVRVIQNAIQLHRQNKLYEKEIEQIDSLTDGDFRLQKDFYRNGNEFFKRELCESEDKNE